MYCSFDDFCIDFATKLKLKIMLVKWADVYFVPYRFIPFHFVAKKFGSLKKRWYRPKTASFVLKRYVSFQIGL